jgi:hypothetical protein
MVKVKGSDVLKRILRSTAERMANELPVTLQEFANAVTIEARGIHEFQTRTGNLERSIQNTVDASNLSMRVFINPDLVTTSSGWNYAVIQHDGSKWIDRNPFVYNAFENHLVDFNNQIKEQIWRILTPNG